MEGRMISHRFHPSVAEQPFLLDEHALGKLQHLLHGLVIVFRFPGVFTHIGHRWDAHKHIVEPQRIVLRTDAGKRSVGQTVLLIEDIVGIVCYQILKSRTFVFQHGLDHGRTDGPAVIEGMGLKHAPYVSVDCLVFLIYLFIIRGNLSQEFHPAIDIVAVSLIASSFISSQNA